MASKVEGFLGFRTLNLSNHEVIFLVGIFQVLLTVWYLLILGLNLPDASKMTT